MTRFYIVRLTLKHNVFVQAIIVFVFGWIVAAMAYISLFSIMALKQLIR